MFISVIFSIIGIYFKTGNFIQSVTLGILISLIVIIVIAEIIQHNFHHSIKHTSINGGLILHNGTVLKKSKTSIMQSDDGILFQNIKKYYVVLPLISLLAIYFVYDIGILHFSLSISLISSIVFQSYLYLLFRNYVRDLPDSRVQFRISYVQDSYLIVLHRNTDNTVMTIETESLKPDMFIIDFKNSENVLTKLFYRSRYLQAQITDYNILKDDGDKFLNSRQTNLFISKGNKTDLEVILSVIIGWLHQLKSIETKQ